MPERVRCPKCGAESASTAQLCYNCNAELHGRASVVESEPLGGSTCRRCGQPVQAGNILCPDCAGTPSRSLTTSGAVSGPAVVSTSTGVGYDPSVIQGYAKMAYARADTITVLYTVAGGLLLGAFGVSAGAVGGAAPVGFIVGAAMGGLLGYFVGNMKANALRLEAQVALCQVEIEKNTRRTREATTA